MKARLPTALTAASTVAVVLTGCAGTAVVDAAAPAEPWTTVAHEIALSGPGGGGYVTDLLPAAGGGAHVLLSTDGGSHLLTVTRTGDGFDVTARTAVPLVHADDSRALDDGRLLVTGPLPEELREPGGPGRGVAVVDPSGGWSPLPVPIRLAAGDRVDDLLPTPVLSADGDVLYAAVRDSGGAGGTGRDVLVAVDTGTGEVAGRRAVGDDLAAVTGRPERTGVGLVSAGDDGVAVVVVVAPAEGEAAAPGHTTFLLRYTPALQPDGPALVLADASDGLHPQAVARDAEGTVFVSLTDGTDHRIVAVPTGSDRPTTVAAGGWPVSAPVLAVDGPAGRALLPTEDGALSIDLTGDGGDGEVVMPCRGEGADSEGPDIYFSGVTDVAVGADHAFLAGECGTAGGGARLWVLGR